uniref:Uncharacterized protein n=1 Tax=Setaria italica TaxID=4555 RepID=K4A430_SETIT
MLGIFTNISCARNIRSRESSSKFAKCQAQQSNARTYP